MRNFHRSSLALQKSQTLSYPDIHMESSSQCVSEERQDKKPCQKTYARYEYLYVQLLWGSWSLSMEQKFDWQPDGNGAPINQPHEWTVFPKPYAAYV